MSHLKPVLFFAAVALIAVFIMTRKPVDKVVNVGDVAPEFVAKDESGQELKLSDLKGNVIFLNFWGTWCLPCRAEMPDMEVLHNRYKDRKFKMVAIAVDTNWGDVKKFYSEYNLTLPSYLDPGRQVADRYNVSIFPETYVIDGRGIVLKHYISQQPWARRQMLDYFDGLIRQEEASAASLQ